MLEDKRMQFDNGTMYFIDTAKMHTLFNTAEDPFYFVVGNIILNEETVNTVTSHLFG